MYKDPLLTPELNEKNKQQLQRTLANSAIKLTNPDTVKSDGEFVSDLLKHCEGLRALESHDE